MGWDWAIVHPRSACQAPTRAKSKLCCIGVTAYAVLYGCLSMQFRYWGHIACGHLPATYDDFSGTGRKVQAIGRIALPHAISNRPCAMCCIPSIYSAVACAHIFPIAGCGRLGVKWLECWKIAGCYAAGLLLCVVDEWCHCIGTIETNAVPEWPGRAEPLPDSFEGLCLQIRIS